VTRNDDDSNASTVEMPGKDLPEQPAPPVTTIRT